MFAVKNPLCENKVNPIGIDADFVKISWQLVSDRHRVRQVGYRVQVAEEAQFHNLLWDSGKIESDQCLHVPVPAESLPLEAEKRYYYRIKAWNQNAEQSDWSEAAYWETGLQSTENWRGEWIAA